MNKRFSTITAVMITAAMAAAPASYAYTAAGLMSVQAAEAAPSSLPAAKYTVKADQLNVRCGPDTSYTVIGTLTRNMKINVISVNNGWAKFKFEGCTAYVSAQYLSKPKKHRSK